MIRVELPESHEDIIERNKATGWPDLSESDRLFAHAYVEERSVIKATRAIGLERDAGYKKLKKPVVAGYIAELEKQYTERRLITREMLEMEYLEALEKLTGREESDLMSPDGTMVRAKKFHGMETVKALDGMAKLIGESGRSGGGGVNINIDLGRLGIAEKVIN